VAVIAVPNLPDDETWNLFQELLARIGGGSIVDPRRRVARAGMAGETEAIVVDSTGRRRTWPPQAPTPHCPCGPDGKVPIGKVPNGSNASLDEFRERTVLLWIH